MRWVAAVVILGLIAACGGSEEQHTIHGKMTLTDWKGIAVDADSPSTGDECWGDEGYDDLEEGAQVRVRDGDGKLLATADLRDGVFDAVIEDCTFRFTVLDVPDADFYSVEVSHRGEVSYSRKEIEGNDWTVALSVG